MAVDLIDPSAQFCTYIGYSLDYLWKKISRATDSLPSLQNRQLALHLLSFGLKRPELWPVVRTTLLELAPKMEQAGHRSDWMPLLTTGIAQGRQQNDPEAVAELTMQLARLHQLQSNYNAAREYFKQSLDGFQTLQERRSQAKVMGRLAYLACLQQQYADGTQLGQQALEMLATNDPERAGIYGALGAIARHRHEWQKCIDYHHRALTLWQQVGDQRMMAWTWRDLGVPYCMMERTAEAIACYERALEIFQIIHDPIHQASTAMNLGNVYLTNNEPAKALPLYASSKIIFEELRDGLRLGKLYTNQGIALRMLGRWSCVIDALTQSITLMRQINDWYHLANAQEELGIVYQRQGNKAKAMKIFSDALATATRIEDDAGRQALASSILDNLCEAKK
ncbi:MAG: tetratricopeptide repeat protein [Chloroflexota bacterium]